MDSFPFVDQFVDRLGSWFGQFQRRAKDRGVPAQNRKDVAQKSMLRLTEASEWLAQRENPDGTAMAVAENEISTELRNERRQRTVPFGDLQVRDERLSPEERRVRRDRRKLLADLLRRLDKSDRRLVVKHDLQGVPLVEIAARLQLKESTVYTQHRRALARLVEEREAWQAREKAAGRDGSAPCVPILFYAWRHGSWRAVLRDVGSQVLRQVVFALLPAALFCAGDALWSRTDAPLQAAALEASGDAAGFLVAPEPIHAGAGLSRRAATTDAPAAPHEARGEAREQAVPPRDAGAPSRPAHAEASLPGAAVIENSNTLEQSLISRAWAALETHTARGDAEAQRLLDWHRLEFPRGQLTEERRALLALLDMRANRESGP